MANRHWRGLVTAVFVILALAAVPLGAQRARFTADDLAGKRVLWIGDSITEGGSYVTDTEYYLERLRPELHFDIISIGRSGETADCVSEPHRPTIRPCVQERLGRALKDVKPQVVVLCYGMNDGIYHPQSADRMKAFEKGIEKISAEVKAAGARFIVLTPPPFDAKQAPLPDDTKEYGSHNIYHDYDSVLADYAHWEMQLPDTVAALVIDLHGPMAAYLAAERQNSPEFSFGQKDGIHPDALGHLLMARLVVQGLGVALPGSDLDAALKEMREDPMYPLVKKAREERSAAWLTYVGYDNNGKAVKTDSVAAVEKDVADLQAQIDAMRRK